ncbi:MAG: glycosyltransferase family 39 protein [Anaerolineae bacterium]|nr:glycosyltransferase family 39 protein [Anaerolineae bacterium]
MSKRFLSLTLIAVALALAGLGHYYLLYQRVYVWDAVVFYVVAAFLLVWAWRRAGATPDRSWALVRAALRRLGLALRNLFSQGATRPLVVVLAMANGLAALAALLIPPPAGLLLALLLWAGGAVLLVALIPRPRPRPIPEAESVPIPVEATASVLHSPFSILHSPPRALAAAGGATFSLLAGYLALRRPPTDDFSALLWLWLTGVVWFLLAFAPSFSVKEAWPRLIHWLRNHRIELAGLAALLLVALAVRAVDLEHIPVNVGGDEGTWGMESLAMFDGRLANPFGARWFAFPSMSFLAWGLSMRLFGETVAGLRMLSALLGAASVLTTFLLARELWGQRVAWLTAILLAFGHYHVHYSRLAVNNIADAFFVTLALWLLVRGLSSRRPYHFALAGAVMGLGWYGYLGARLVGVIVALYLAAWSVGRVVSRSGGQLVIGHWSLVIGLGAALVVAAPLLLHYVKHPYDFDAGANRVSIFASGWLAREQEITGRSATSLLLQQFWKSITAFHHTLDPTFWYRPSIPLLDVVSGVLFILGMVWVVVFWRRPANGLLLLWFWLALILGWVVTENPPSSQRLVIVAPALALLVALGLNWLMELGQRVRSGSRRLWDGVGVLLLVVVTVLNLHYYFVTYTPTRVYGNPTAEVTTDLARYLMQQDDDYVVYFHGPPWIYWDFGTLRFMARGVDGVDVPPPDEGEAPVPDPTWGMRFVFTPLRLEELDGVQARYPGGTTQSFYSTADGRLLFTLYEVPPR